jgi:predicted MFS family arabinose efflux permease
LPSPFAAYRSAFAGLPRDVWLLATATLVNRSGAMVLPFLSLYVTQARGLPEAAAGAVLVAYGLGSIAGSWIGGNLCHRFGALRVQEASLLLAGWGYLAIPLAPSTPFALGAVVFVASLLADAFRPAIMAAVADAAPDAVRTRALALVRLAANLGFSVGPSVGGLLASIDYTWLFVGDAVTCWLAFLVLWRCLGVRAPSGSRPTAVPAHHVAAHRDPPFLALLAIVFVLTIALFQTFSTLPLYLHDVYRLRERTIGLLLGFNGLLIVLFEMVLVQRIERRVPLRVMAVGALFLCSGLALIPLGRSAAFAALALAVLTFGEMLSLPFANALAADRAGEGARGAYMGLYSAAFSAAFVVAPALGIFVYHRYGGGALWYGVGLLGPVLALACLALRRVFSTTPR